MQVFISYKREDESFARRLYQHIKEWGYSPWLDVEQIKPDENWDAAIDTGLKHSEVVLGVLTPESVKSDNVLNEWSYALETQKRLVLLWLRDVSPADISHRFIRRQRIDFRENLSEGVDQLKKLLASPTKTLPEKRSSAVLSLSTRSFQETTNRVTMLAKVYDFWVTGVLENALHESGAFELGLEVAPESVLRHMDFGDYALPVSTKIADVFRNLNSELLILGAPGSGKTIMLLQLARDLIREAQQDTTVPIPVVFNLSSWAAERKPFNTWLIDELRNKYQVPKKTAAAWVEGERLLFLLDGLDEVAEAYREQCVGMINDFRRDYRSSDMAVCSRTADYESLASRLDLQGAIELQPLSSEIIYGYLMQDELMPLRQAMAHDDALRELAGVPFLLNTMALAYWGATATNLRLPDAQNTKQRRREHLFEHYIEKRLRHIASEDARYTPRQVRHYLTTLAGWMVKNQQTVFFIEGLQPDWITDIGRYPQYRILTKLAVALSYSTAYGVTYGLAVGLAFGVWHGLLVGILLALLFSLGTMPSMNPEKIELDETLRLKWDKHDLIVGIRTALLVIVISLSVGYVFGVLVEALPVALVAGAVGILGAGISSAENLELRSKPNQGVRRSVRNALRVGTQVTCIVGVISLLLTDVLINLETGVAVGLLAGIGFGLFLGLIFGLRVLIKHLVLRLILWRNGQIPLNYADFLDYAAMKLHILRKVGGGYIFIHRYLLDYFAMLDKESALE